MFSDHRQTLVIIGGWGFSAAVLQPLAQCFEPNYRVSCIGLLEIFDHTAAAGHDLESAVAYLHGRIPAGAMVMGWSLGGLMAVQLCAKYPARYQALFTLATSAQFFQSDDWMAIPMSTLINFKQMAAAQPQALMQNFVHLANFPRRDKVQLVFLKHHAIEFFAHPAALLCYLEWMLTLDIRESYQQLQLPSYHLFFAKDAIVPLDTALQVQSLNADAIVDRLDGLGHAGFLDNPKGIAQKIMELQHATS